MILIVNHEPNHLVLAASQLLMLNYHIATADAETSAVDVARQINPLLILMEIMLKDGDGWGALEHLKSDPLIRHIPVVVISSQSDYDSRQRAFAAGCSAFLAKPYSVNQLRGVVQQYLPREKMTYPVD